MNFQCRGVVLVDFLKIYSNKDEKLRALGVLSYMEKHGESVDSGET